MKIFNFPKPRCYAIISGGAVGCSCGGPLSQSGCDVHILFPTTYHQIMKHGLTIREKNGDTLYQSIKAYSDIKDMPPCDIIIVALKTTQNIHLKKLLTPLLKKDSIIMTMQNGLGSEKDIAAVTKNHSILSAITTIGAVRINPFVIQLNNLGIVKLAVYYNHNASLTDKMIQNIVTDFTRAKIPIEVHNDYLQLRWEKLLWNIPFNGLCITKGQTADKIAKNYAPLLRKLATEIIAIAEAYHKKIPKEYFENLIHVTQNLPDFKSSMVRDYEDKKPLEIGAIYMEPLKAAKSKNIPCPLLEDFCHELIALDLKNRLNSSPAPETQESFFKAKL